MGRQEHSNVKVNHYSSLPSFHSSHVQNKLLVGVCNYKSKHINLIRQRRSGMSSFNGESSKRQVHMAYMNVRNTRETTVAHI